MADAVRELTRGIQVAVQGRLRQNEYTDREGNRRQAVVVRGGKSGREGVEIGIGFVEVCGRCWWEFMWCAGGA